MINPKENTLTSNWKPSDGFIWTDDGLDDEADEGMHPEDIKASIRKTGVTPADLARELGVSHMSVSYVIEGRHTSRRIADRIAEITGKSLNQLWPGKYDKAAQPAPAAEPVSQPKRLKTAAEVKAEFVRNGVSIGAWAEANGFDRFTVYGVIAGRHKGSRGATHRIAVALGMKAGEIVDPKKFCPVPQEAA